MELKWTQRKLSKGTLHQAVLPVGSRTRRHVEIYQAADLTCMLTFPSGFVRQHPNLAAAKADAHGWYTASITNADGDRLVVLLPVGDRHIEVRQHPSKRFKVTYMGVTIDGLDRFMAEAKIGAFVLAAADWGGLTK